MLEKFCNFFSLEGISNVLPELTGGILKEDQKFQLGQITISMESRHWIKGESYPLEIDAYFYDSSKKNRLFF